MDGKPLPWLVGLTPCDAAPKQFFSRAYTCATSGTSASQGCASFARGSTDTREWSVTAIAGSKEHYTIKSLSTGRCLAVAENPASPDDVRVAGMSAQIESSRVVLMPCNVTSASQQWAFGKGLHSPSSMFAASSPNLALTIGNETLFAASYGKDQHAVPSAAYGDTVLTFASRTDQDDCTSRNCQNYDNKQMWYYDPVEQFLRATT
eukprot:SAG31_NODE_3351_length_4373_cov_5.225784_5_plen_206_part_00